jgi:glycosyltransferase involved in cell wall biosynthesis
MEYVSLGIPVVAPRLKAIEYYFSEDMVAYYEPENLASLTEAVYRLYREPERRHRQAETAGTFLSEFGWDRQGNELVNLYHTLAES